MGASYQKGFTGQSGRLQLVKGMEIVHCTTPDRQGKAFGSSLNLLVLVASLMGANHKLFLKVSYYGQIDAILECFFRSLDSWR